MPTKKGCTLSPTPFGIYINKLKGGLEEVACVNTTLARIVIIILLMLMILFLWKGVPMITKSN
jgi:hypothetical protein